MNSTSFKHSEHDWMTHEFGSSASKSHQNHQTAWVHTRFEHLLEHVSVQPGSDRTWAFLATSKERAGDQRLVMMARSGTGTFEKVDAFNPRKAGPSNAKPQAVQNMRESSPLLGNHLSDRQAAFEGWDLNFAYLSESRLDLGDKHQTYLVVL